MKLINRLIAKNLVPAALIGASALLGSACSNDSNGANGDGGSPDAGSGGKAAGGAGGKASGGSAGLNGGAGGATGGAATGGKTSVVDAGKPDASDEGDAKSPDSGSDAQPDTGPGPEAVLCADGGAVTSSLLVAGTTFCAMGCTTSEVAAIDVAHGCVLGRATFPDSDIVPRTSNHHAFVLERTNGVLEALSTSAEVTARIDLNPHQDGSTTPMNPHDVVYATPTGAPAKAYVSLYGGDAIAVVDLASGTVKSRIDLSSFKDASDTDGSSDPDVGFYDATTGRAYFVLQRIDVTTAYVAPFAVHCPTVASLLIAIDAATDTLVDLNGATAGVGLPLSFISPTDVAVDGRRALFLSNGCIDATKTRIHAGVESVNLDTLAGAVLYTSTAGFLNHIALLSTDSAALESFDDNFATVWNEWAPSSTTLGATLTGVPDGAIAEDATALIGVGFDSGKPRVKRFHIDDKTLTTVVSSPWAGAFTSAAGVALVQ